MSRLRSLRRDDQAGFSLVELLVTMSIMAIGFTVVLGAISVFFSSTSAQRTSADLDAAMRTYVERLADAPYVNCASATAYNSVAVPTGITASIQPKYWDGTPAPAGYSSTCAADKGAQQLTVTLKRTTPTSSQEERLVIVKRDEVQP